MKLSLLPLALATGALVAAAVVVALIFGASNGGGGGGSDLASYFQSVNTVETDMSTQDQALRAQYPDTFSKKQDTIDYLTASTQAWADNLDQLKAIDPPSAASAAHSSFIDATDGVRAAYDTLSTGMDSVNDDEAAIATFFGAVDNTPFDDYATACQALQDLADTSNVTVTLHC